MTPEELNNRCAYWQRVLRLQDWQVEARFVGTGELDEGTIGNCDVWRDSRRAIVKVASPGSYDHTHPYRKAFPLAEDWEVVLVHELLHIPLDGILERDAEDFKAKAQEQAIVAISEALVSLERGL